MKIIISKFHLIQSDISNNYVFGVSSCSFFYTVIVYTINVLMNSISTNRSEHKQYIKSHLDQFDLNSTDKLGKTINLKNEYAKCDMAFIINPKYMR